MSREEIFSPSTPNYTHDETQKLVVEELYKWLGVEHKTLDEQWKHLLSIKEFSQFVVDYADRDTLATAFRRVLDVIVCYGKPFEKKVKVSESIEHNIFSIAISLSMDGLEGTLIGLIGSALRGYEEEQKQKHKNVAKLRVDLHKRDLYKRIDEGEL